METLPDLLGPNLDVVFIGINPSLYSVAKGHYFARPQNRFWPALSLSRLSQPMRDSLQVDKLTPEHDVLFPKFGFGLTDLAKRPTAQASHLSAEEYRLAAPGLQKRLEEASPKALCFHGMMSYRPFVKYAMGLTDKGASLGLQPYRFAEAPIWVIPNPSPANATYSLTDLVSWYDRLEEFLERTPL